MGPPSYMLSVVDGNVVMRRIPVVTSTFLMANSGIYRPEPDQGLISVFRQGLNEICAFSGILSDVDW